MYIQISVPPNLNIDTKSYKKIVRLENIKTVSTLKKVIDSSFEKYKNNTNELFFYIEDLTILHFIKFLRYKNLNIIFSVTAKNLVLLKRLSDILPQYNLFALLDEGIKNSELFSVLDYLISLDIKSLIEPNLFKKIDKTTFEELKNIIQNPKLVSKVEPYFSILNYLNEKRYGNNSLFKTLWQIFSEENKKFLYINKDGYVTLSKRFDKEKRYLYHIDKNILSKKDSKFYKVLNSYEEELFFDNFECAVCENYELCKGFLKFEDKDYDCSIFKNSLTDMKKVIHKESKHENL